VGDPDRVRIHYRRPPDRETIFDQRVLYRDESVVVTLAESMKLPAPMIIAADVVLETGSSVVWSTFPGLWHDIGQFHRADGTFTGYYANILTPPRMDRSTWHTTDLYLDVWWPDGGEVCVLDEDELDEALELGHLDVETAERAREEAARVVRLAHEGVWPPAVTREWTLERVGALGGDPLRR
jgi:predicted RNA-binding protein associated with RNAse of E/G family